MNDDVRPRPDPVTSGRVRLRRSLLLTVASAVLPGSGLLGAPRRGLRILGGGTAALSLAAACLLGWRAATDLSSLTQWLQRDSTLTQVTSWLAVLAVVWVALIALTQIVTRPAGVAGGRRAIGAALVTALAFGIAAPTVVAARYTHDANRMLDRVLPQASAIKASHRTSVAATKAADPWADTPRVNILLLGADGDAARARDVAQFGVRTDTIMLASIDTVTGDTTLIQIPRNVRRTPFPAGSTMAQEFPRGFRGDGDEGDWYVNSIWEKTAPGGDYAHLFEGTTFPGAEALKEGIEGITGLGIDRFVMLNIDGLSNLIDAMGGVEINVNRRLPIGGNRARGIRPSGHLEVGEAQRLDGYHAMWYARSRYDSSDYDRMARQSCLVDAIIDQANPETLLTSFEPIAAASADLLTTDITRDEFGAFIDLAFRVKDTGTVSRLVFAPGRNGYSYNDPDFEAMRAAVAAAISPAPTVTASALPPTASAPRPPSASPSATPSTSDEASTDEQRVTDGTQNVGDACAWQGGR